jgi:DNA-binding GntR family transcriptional regulator
MLSQNHYTQLSEQVAAKIRDLIARGEIKPGEWLRQEHLAQVVGVSHTPFREAVKLLVAEGLLEHIPHRGVRVIQFSVQDIDDIYTVRSVLEARAIAAAAEQITEHELNDLETILAEMNEYLAPEQISLYRELNRRFHQGIYTASRHPYIIRVLNQVWAFSPSMLWAQFSPTSSSPLSSRTLADPVEHENILNALRRHDSKTAEKLMREHIETAGRELIQAIQ